MQNLYNATEAATCANELELRAYTSRLLGSNPALVLHGGGNTSVKLREKDIFGEAMEVLYVKGSGWDLGTIQPAGFAPVRMDALLKLAQLKTLSDTEMARQLRIATINPAAPMPSVEAILHASIPFKWVDHTHTDALIMVMNTPSGEKRVRELYGTQVVVVPYVMPGFDLAKASIECYAKQAGPKTIGMVLMNHGLFTWGDSAKESYDRMIALVSKAENYLKRHKAWNIGLPKIKPPVPALSDTAWLRLEVSRAAGGPMIVQSHTDALSLSFVQRKDVSSISRRGPATPDHVIRTKRVPLVGRDVAGYVAEYGKYFQTHSVKAKQALTMLDPAPRVVLDSKLGVLTIGKTAKDASIAWDVYRQTMEMVTRTEMLESWKPLGSREIFEVEYWDLEQAKLKTSNRPPMFQGEIMLVTGAASGIGLACAKAFIARGAAVVGLDLNPAVRDVIKRPEYLGIVGDISDEAGLRKALGQTVERFGGLDMLVLNAGIFPSSQSIGVLDSATWRKTMQINLDANLNLLREAHPLLKLAPGGGRVVVIASKNVPAPGPGAAAYSSSKAALTQLARVAALEWGADNIRVNVLHPNAVFDTGLWTQEVLEKRAASYKQSVEEYKRSNVLKIDVTSHHVAELAADLCGPSFSRTTGAQIPIDGGNDRVI